jgi:hypothetical protein
MTGNQGNLSHLLPSPSPHPHVIVGNGHALPITHVGHTTLSTSNNMFQLNNVLVTPNLIKDLLSVRKFIIDNFVSIEFDPFGLSVKDLRTKNEIVRCNSSGDLYPFWWLSSPALALSTTMSSSTLWNHHLGHLSSQALSHLAGAFCFHVIKVLRMIICVMLVNSGNMFVYLLIILLLKQVAHFN